MFGGSSPYLRPGEWQVTAIARRAEGIEHFQGREPYPELDPFGPINTQTLLNVDLTRGLTRRLSVSLNVPLQTSDFSVFRAPPGQTQRQWINTSANGLGDVSARLNYWLLPTGPESRWNLQLSAALKAPTGRANVTDTWFDGRQIPVDISVQPGDKAWGPILTLAGFRQFDWFTVFGSANYYFNPRNTTGVSSFFPSITNPRNTFPNSSHDQFTYQVGSSFRTRQGWPTPTLAYRISGVPIFDVFGKSDGFRRPGTVGFVEPGVSYAIGRHVFTFSTPIRSYVNVKDSPATGRTEDATIPKIVFQLAYFVRFGR